ncbi:MAG: UbiA family prenyltransferase [Flavobacteriales bacterium]|jgi:4-hydroxybenzoate polyprenyltransferase|nr:UbiA family prenyltransferase [Flavobacteriales bacterium]
MLSTDSKKQHSQSDKKLSIFVKLLAMLSLVRWYNVLLITIGLYLSSIFMLQEDVSKITVLKELSLHLNILAIANFIMAGYIINAFYDFEKDMINHPETTVFDRIISKKFCLNSYIFFLFLGTVLSLFLGWKVFIFNSFFSTGLWIYSHKLRKKPLTGEMGASLLSVAPFASLSLHYMQLNSTIFLFVCYIFAITFTREVIKKMVSLKGDLIVKEKSIPILFGIRNTKYIILTLMFLSLAPIVFIFPSILLKPIVYYFGLSSILIISSLYLLKHAKTTTHFNKINNIYKIIITLAVFSIFLY